MSKLTPHRVFSSMLLKPDYQWVIKHWDNKNNHERMKWSLRDLNEDVTHGTRIDFKLLLRRHVAVGSLNKEDWAIFDRIYKLYPESISMEVFETFYL